MPRATKEQVLRRRDEILDACDELCRETSFKEVTIKAIAARTSFSRPSIYNYFQTIEEIFLGLLQREYERWAVELEQVRDGGERLDAEGLSCAIAHSLESHWSLLRIQSTNLYEIEENSREERLVEFKKAVCLALSTMDECIRKFLPELSDEDRSAIRYCFVPFLYGIYSSTSLTEKQKHAMNRAGMCCAVPGVNDICRIFLLKLFRP